MDSTDQNVSIHPTQKTSPEVLGKDKKAPDAPQAEEKFDEPTTAGKKRSLMGTFIHMHSIHSSLTCFTETDVVKKAEQGKGKEKQS